MIHAIKGGAIALPILLRPAAGRSQIRGLSESFTILAGLSIQAANGSTKAELKRTAQMALRHLGY